MSAYNFLEWVTKVSYEQMQSELQDILSRITLFVMGATEFIARKNKHAEHETLTPMEFAAKVISGKMPSPGSYQALNAREIRLKKERDKKAKRAAMAKQLADQLAYKKREIEKSLNAQNPDEKDKMQGGSDGETPRGMNRSYAGGQNSSTIMLTEHQIKRQEEVENLKKEQAMNPLVGVPLYDFLVQQDGGTYLGAIKKESGSEEESSEEEIEVQKVGEEAQSDKKENQHEGSDGEKEAENSSQITMVKRVKKEKKRKDIDPEAQLEEFSNPKELSKIILKITQFEKKDERTEKFEPNFDKLSLFLKYKKRTTKKVTDPYELLNSTSAKIQKAQAQSQAQAEAAKAALRAEQAKQAATSPVASRPPILMLKKELKQSSPEVNDYFQKKRAKMRGTNTNSFNDSERDESLTDPSRTAGNLTFTMGATGSVKRGVGKAEKFNTKTPLEPIRGSELAESSRRSSYNQHNESTALRKAKAKSLANQIRRVNQKLPALKDQDSQHYDSNRGRGDSSRGQLTPALPGAKKSQSPFRLLGASQENNRAAGAAQNASHDLKKKEFQNIYMTEFNIAFRLLSNM